MKKFIMKLCIIIIILLVLVNWGFFSMSRLPKGELIGEELSPNEAYILKTYRCNGGATTAYAIRGELVDTRSKKVKNLYWNYRESEAEVTWLDDENVMINNIALNVKRDVYDFRKTNKKK